MTSGWNKTRNIRQETNLLQKIAHHNNTHHPCPSQHQRSLFGKRTITVALWCFCILRSCIWASVTVSSECIKPHRPFSIPTSLIYFWAYVFTCRCAFLKFFPFHKQVMQLSSVPFSPSPTHTFTYLQVIQPYAICMNGNSVNHCMNSHDWMK